MELFQKIQDIVTPFKIEATGGYALYVVGCVIFGTVIGICEIVKKIIDFF